MIDDIQGRNTLTNHTKDMEVKDGTLHITYYTKGEWDDMMAADEQRKRDDNKLWHAVVDGDGDECYPYGRLSDKEKVKFESHYKSGPKVMKFLYNVAINQQPVDPESTMCKFVKLLTSSDLNSYIWQIVNMLEKEGMGISNYSLHSYLNGEIPDPKVDEWNDKFTGQFKYQYMTQEIANCIRDGKHAHRGTIIRWLRLTREEQEEVLKRAEQFLVEIRSYVQYNRLAAMEALQFQNHPVLQSLMSHHQGSISGPDEWAIMEDVKLAMKINGAIEGISESDLERDLKRDTHSIYYWPLLQWLKADEEEKVKIMTKCLAADAMVGTITPPTRSICDLEEAAQEGVINRATLIMLRYNYKKSKSHLKMLTKGVNNFDDLMKVYDGQGIGVNVYENYVNLSGEKKFAIQEEIQAISLSRGAQVSKDYVDKKLRGVVEEDWI
jgi:predicted Fe-S protein YdhL (DUF1289 family)